MIEWSIQFLYRNKIDKHFINDFFKFLVNNGVHANAGRFYIHINNPDTYINMDEKEAMENYDSLYDIIDLYLQNDLTTTAFSLLIHFRSGIDDCFNLGIYPHGKDKYIIILEADEYSITSRESYLAYLQLCKELFNRFNFPYGAYHRDLHTQIPLNEDLFLKEKPTNVIFYSKLLVDRIGLEKLLSTPAFRVEALDNCGVMLLVSDEPYWNYEKLEPVWHHLGYI